jgi:hypothetical protein
MSGRLSRGAVEPDWGGGSRLQRHAFSAMFRSLFWGLVGLDWEFGSSGLLFSKLTNRHRFDARSSQNLQNPPNTLRRKFHLGTNILAASGPHWTYPHVIRALLHGQLCLGGRRDGQADDCVWTQQGAGEGEGHVRLPDVYAMRA